MELDAEQGNQISNAVDACYIYLVWKCNIPKVPTLTTGQVLPMRARSSG